MQNLLVSACGVSNLPLTKPARTHLHQYQKSAHWRIAARIGWHLLGTLRPEVLDMIVCQGGTIRPCAPSHVAYEVRRQGTTCRKPSDSREVDIETVEATGVSASIKDSAPTSTPRKSIMECFQTRSRLVFGKVGATPGASPISLCSRERLRVMLTSYASATRQAKLARSSEPN